MALILHIETSSVICSAALAEKGELLDEIIAEKENDHAAQLAVIVNSLLDQQKIKPQALNAIAISAGPGSYTGLRIGASFAKGMCHALNIRLIALNTLQCMAAGAQMQYAENNILYAPLIDARRMEVYTAVLDGKNNFIRPPEAVVMETNDFRKLLAENKILFFGSGLAKTKHLLQHHHSLFKDDFTLLANHMTQIAWLHYLQAGDQNIALFEPQYLKPFSGTARISDEQAE
ncbi:MAG: tRNA (adenosine(37)-N6)-threonylcarbamoyltransferase complex dimerization subunit type 1 TsaB [Chitinophagales bacterium]